MANGSLLPHKLPKGGRSQGLLNQPRIDPSLAPLVNNIFAASPLLAKYQKDFAVIRGRPMIPGDDRQLESYPKDESWNPMPGSATTELYNNSAPPAEQQQLIMGDFLHHLARIDPKWDAMKRDVLPPEYQADPQTYASRGDEYLMGYLTPDKADEWRKGGAYGPEQQKKLELMRRYLFGGQ